MAEREIQTSGRIRDGVIIITLQATEETSLVFTSTLEEIVEDPDGLIEAMVENAGEYIVQVLEAMAAEGERTAQALEATAAEGERG